MGEYNIILSDNPWTYEDTANAGNRGAEHKYKKLPGRERSTMTMEELRRLRVADLAAKDCAHFMWVTGPFMHEGMHLMKQYGFKYIGVAFTWIKVYKDNKIFIGGGHYTRSNPEFVLLGIRGRMADKRVSRGVRSVIISEPLGHSRKPPELRVRIEELFGDIPRVELFARKPDVDPGWVQTGLEFDNTLVEDFILEQTKREGASQKAVFRKMRT